MPGFSMQSEIQVKKEYDFSKPYAIVAIFQLHHLSNGIIYIKFTHINSVVLFNIFTKLIVLLVCSVPKMGNGYKISRLTNARQKIT
jgi:hypothetical protein